MNQSVRDTNTVLLGADRTISASGAIPRRQRWPRTRPERLSRHDAYRSIAPPHAGASADSINVLAERAIRRLGGAVVAPLTAQPLTLSARVRAVA